MPIEFRCTGCSKLLRTPDESAGKKAKCPQCGAIVDVPAASQADPQPGPGAAPFASPAANPFGDSAPPPGRRVESFDPNPYAAPTTIQPAAKAPFAKLEHNIISFDEVLHKAFDLTRRQLGQIALCGLVYLAAMIATGMLSRGLTQVFIALQVEPLQPIVEITEQVISFPINTYFQLGLAIFGLRLVRTGSAQVSDLFQVGPYYLRGLGLFLVIALICYIPLLLCLVPGFVSLVTGQPLAVTLIAFAAFGLLGGGVMVYLMFRFFLAGLFLVDRNTGIAQSLHLSDQFMAGNKFTAFLLSIITALACMLFVVVTCCIGIVVAAPFMLGVLYPTIYILATGQSTYDDLNPANA